MNPAPCRRGREVRPTGRERGDDGGYPVSRDACRPMARSRIAAGRTTIFGYLRTSMPGKGSRVRRSAVRGWIEGSPNLLLECINRGRDNISCMALNADSTIADLLREKPESAQVLFRFGMGCLGCAIANNETVREAAQAHGVPLEEMLSALGIPEA